ncbi:MAG: AI-2E family transporter, partial [Bacteroidota bacterium]
LALIGFYLTIIIILWLVLPLFASQLAELSDLDTDQVIKNLREPLRDYEYELARRGFVFDSEEAMRTWMETQYDEWMNLERISGLIDDVISFAGTFLIGFFSVTFVAFFLLKDRKLFPMILLFLSPAHYNRGLIRVYYQVKKLLRRYFTGLILQMLILATIVFTGLSIFGIENALLIATAAAFMNIIPYLGPILGFILGSILTLSHEFSVGDPDVGIIMVKLMSVFAVMQIVDNMLLQPLIYSSSVKAHPLEIFLVILMAGKLAGVGGMIVAVPTYTVLRVVLAEFMSSNEVVKSMTKRLNTPGR